MSLQFLHERKSLAEESSQFLSENDGPSVIVSNTLRSHFYEVKHVLYQIILKSVYCYIEAEDGIWKEYLDSNINSNRERKRLKMIMKEVGGDLQRVISPVLVQFKNAFQSLFILKQRQYSFVNLQTVLEVLRHLYEIDQGRYLI